MGINNAVKPTDGRRIPRRLTRERKPACDLSPHIFTIVVPIGEELHKVRAVRHQNTSDARYCDACRKHIAIREQYYRVKYGGIEWMFCAAPEHTTVVSFRVNYLEQMLDQAQNLTPDGQQEFDQTASEVLK